MSWRPKASSQAHQLAEHLARITLAAPVQALSLQALGVQRWGPDSASLLPQDLAGGEPLPICLERLSARLGPGRVLAGRLQTDHRPQHMQHWQPAIEVPPAPASVRPATATAWQPPWLLPEPEPLRLVSERPHYRGQLTMDNWGTGSAPRSHAKPNRRPH